MAYVITQLEEGNTFIANGMVVGIEACKWQICNIDAFCRLEDRP